jgi:hypothetical protein
MVTLRQKILPCRHVDAGNDNGAKISERTLTYSDVFIASLIERSSLIQKHARTQTHTHTQTFIHILCGMMTIQAKFCKVIIF